VFGTINLLLHVLAQSLLQMN